MNIEIDQRIGQAILDLHEALEFLEKGKKAEAASAIEGAIEILGYIKNNLLSH